jgi:hypothetical protein
LGGNWGICPGKGEQREKSVEVYVGAGNKNNERELYGGRRWRMIETDTPYRLRWRLGGKMCGFGYVGLS